MRFFYLIFVLLVLTSCNKPKSVLICGDHICVNNTEAKQYFEENLSIEVKIIDQKKKSEIDLVQLNLTQPASDKRKISIKRKENTNQEIKVLSKKEIKKIKTKIKKNKSKNETVKKTIKRDSSRKLRVSTISKNEKKIKENKINKKVKGNQNHIIDICTVLEKCSIEEISNYLIKQGKNREYPDITTREKKL